MALTLSNCFFCCHVTAVGIGRDPVKSYPQGRFLIQGDHGVSWDPSVQKLPHRGM